LNLGIQTVVKPYPEGQWYKAALVGFGKDAQALRVALEEVKRQEATQGEGW
jgi:hypothetical protein